MTSVFSRHFSVSGHFVFSLILFSVALIAVAAGLFAGPAVAQSELELRAIGNRMERIERDLLDLQRQTYRSGEPAGAGAGPSGGSAESANLLVRLDELETNLRRLTGQVEELSFQVGQTDQRLNVLSSDIEFRFQELGQPGAGGVAEPAPASSKGTAPVAATSSGPPGSSTLPGASLPRSLGTLPQSAAGSSGGESGAATPSAATPPAQLASLANAAPEEAYEGAINLLKRGDFASAETAFSQFLAVHPTHELAGNAQYWLGETYYVRGSYKDAADAFLKGYTTYSESSKAPDSLLKLGITLAALNQKESACATLGELGRRFPSAPQAVIQRAKLEQSKAGCR